MTRPYKALWTRSGSENQPVPRTSPCEVWVLSIIGPDKVDEEVGPMFHVEVVNTAMQFDAFLDELICLHDGEENASDCMIGGRGDDPPDFIRTQPQSRCPNCGNRSCDFSCPD